MSITLNSNVIFTTPNTAPNSRLSQPNIIAPIILVSIYDNVEIDKDTTINFSHIIHLDSLYNHTGYTKHKFNHPIRKQIIIDSTNNNDYNINCKLIVENNCKNFELVNNDVLKEDLKVIIEQNLKNLNLKQARVAANLPYYITTPIIMKLLEGKVALITGGTRGIGKAIAMKYASEGANIAFTYVSNSEVAKQVEEEITAMGVTCKGYISNAADFAATEAVVKNVQQDFGRIDILVNNAGITKDGLMLRMSEEQWDNVINVNLKSVFNYCHAASTQMMRQRSGSIIAMSSIVGVAGNPGQVNYAASKAGIIGLVKSLSKELGSRNIRVNAIAPGYILTDMTLALPDAAREEITKMIPMRRCGDAQEVAKVALFLASDLASYVSGQVLGVNGAMG